MDRQIITEEDFIRFAFTTTLASEAIADRGSRKLEMVTSFQKFPFSGLHPTIQYVIRVGTQITLTTHNLEHAIREYNKALVG